MKDRIAPRFQPRNYGEPTDVGEETHSGLSKTWGEPSLTHMPSAPVKPKKKAKPTCVAKDGECKAYPIRDSDKCYFHSRQDG